MMRFLLFCLLCTTALGQESKNPNIRAWPIIVSSESEDGSRTIWATPLFHYNREKDGEESFHIINYLQGENYWALLPLAYQAGEHFGAIPLYFKGPGYHVAPPLLLYYHENRVKTLWVTPLFHVSWDQESMESLHFLNYMQGEDLKCLFPLAYHSDKGYWGVNPLFYKWPMGWCALPLLSAGWENSSGENTLWITPLFHQSERSFHLLNYYQARDAWGLFPLYFSHARGWTAPPLLSAAWEDGDQRKHLWITPFFHHTQNQKDDVWFHLFNYFQGPDYKILFPLMYQLGQGEDKRFGLPPFYFEGESSWWAPLLLSAGWEGEDGETTQWITPFYHATRNREGEEWFHLLNYFQGPDYRFLFPLMYQVGEGEDKRYGLLPFYFKGKNSWWIPPLLTGGWEDEETNLWITPFYHLTENQEGDQWFHLFNYFQGPSYKALLPFYVKKNNDWWAPLFLSGGWENELGGESLWITPLFHHTSDDKNNQWLHVLNYFQGPDYKCLFPLAYLKDNNQFGITPFFYKGENAWFSPLLLSGGWENSLWITPLYHHSLDEEGNRSFHVLNYFQGPDYKALLPFWYVNDSGGLGVLPLFFKGKDYWAAPLLLSGAWDRNLWITPFYHHTLDPKGEVVSRHFLNWYEDQDLKTLFPLYWRWKDKNDADRTFVPLLFNSLEESDGDASYSFLWPLTEYRKGSDLDLSLSTQIKPFVYQNADEDYEFNFLWRLFHLREHGGKSQVGVGPFWWSERPAKESPYSYQFLGGLFARDCNYAKQTYQHRLLWFIPIGSEQEF